MMTILVSFLGIALMCPLFKIGYRHRVYGKHHLPKGGGIVASNHASFIDPPLIGFSIYPRLVAYLARDTLFRSVLGWILRHLGCYPIKRGEGNAQVFRLAIKLVREGKLLVIFPEGTRSKDGNLQAGQTGVGFLVRQCHCPVIPTYVHGTFEAWNCHAKRPKMWGKTACVFGSALDFSHLEKAEDKKQAQAQIVEEIMAAVARLKQWYLSGAEGQPP